MLNFKNIKENHIKFIICLLAIISFFSTINILPPLDRDESRYVQSTIQMIETGDFFNINFLDTPRLKKPPGIYWLQAGAGLTVQKLLFLDKPPLWSFRLPSAVAASISLFLVYLLGKLIFSSSHALLASLLFLSLPIVVIESNMAKTDSVLTCLTLCIIYFLAKIIFINDVTNRIPATYVYMGWTILGFSFLVKGPIVFIIILLFLIFFKIFNKGFSFLSIKPVTGFILFSIVCVPWFIYIFFGSNADILIGDIKKDFFEKLISSQESHGAPPGSYIMSLFIVAWPLALFLLPTCVWTYINRKDKRIKFLLAYILPSWLLFEIIPTKLPHYILPLIPGLVLLTAVSIVEVINNPNLIERVKKTYLNIYTIFPFLGIFIIIYGIIFLGIEYGNGLTLEVLVVIFSFSIIGLLSIYHLFYKSYVKALIIATFGSIVALNLFLTLVPNQLQEIWISERIYKEYQKQNINDVVLLGYSEPSLIYRLGSNTKIAGSSIDAINLLIKHNINNIIIEEKFLNSFINLSKKNNIIVEFDNKVLEGFNYSKGKYVKLKLLRIEF